MSLFLGCYLFQLLTQKCSEIFFDTVSNYFTVIERWHDVADIPCENENSCEKLTFAQLFTTLLLKLWWTNIYLNDDNIAWVLIGETEDRQKAE